MVQILLYWSIWSTFSVTPGCIVPVAPEFQNPPSAPNFPPSFTSTVPFARTTVAAPQAVDGQQEFLVTVVDPNPGDLLYVRWVSDYPPFTQSDTRLIVDDPNGMSQTGTQGTDIVYRTTQCKDFAPGADHQLVVIVSDRKFRKYDQFSSEFRYNLVEPDATAIMTGWSIINCP
jgi:hypothetical protein